MVAQPITAQLPADGTVGALEAAISLWAAFDGLDGIPALAEAQRAFDDARGLLAARLVALGLEPERLDGAISNLALSQPQPRGRSDPRSIR